MKAAAEFQDDVNPIAGAQCPFRVHQHQMITSRRKDQARVGYKLDLRRVHHARHAVLNDTAVNHHGFEAGTAPYPNATLTG